jgi:hypothetical protein
MLEEIGLGMRTVDCNAGQRGSAADNGRMAPTEPLTTVSLTFCVTGWLATASMAD